jgi:hypothetical protein
MQRQQADKCSRTQCSRGVGEKRGKILEERSPKFVIDPHNCWSRSSARVYNGNTPIFGNLQRDKERET